MVEFIEKNIPVVLGEIIAEFNSVTQSERLELLLEFADSLPPLPERFVDHPQLLEKVAECQSPLFLKVEKSVDGLVLIYFSAPREAPTTRGFAAILYEGLNSLSVAEILEVPDDVVNLLGLDAAITPLRMRGMYAMLQKIKTRVKQLV